MSSPFSRTLRSIDADHFWLSLSGMLIAIVLLSAWGIWFSTASIAIFKTSINAHITGQEKIVADFPKGAFRVHEVLQKQIIAEFPPESLASICSGQSAFFIPDISANQHAPIVAVVKNVGIRLDKDNTETKPYYVELAALFDPKKSVNLAKGLTGQVQIRTGRVSPADMLMHSVGLNNNYLNTNQMPSKAF